MIRIFENAFVIFTKSNRVILVDTETEFEKQLDLYKGNIVVAFDSTNELIEHLKIMKEQK